MKALQVIQSAYRCTIEEQDDPAIWIAQVLKLNGGDVDILLRGNAVNYAVTGQDASGLSFGDKKQTQPPQIDRDLQSGFDKKMKVYIVSEDLDIRGIPDAKIIDGVTKLTRQELVNLFAQYDQIWHW
jgi:sulfur relay (sulfurtransferase) DsrF/TusC family protein